MPAKADKAIREKVYDSMDGTSLRCKSLILSDIALAIQIAATSGSAICFKDDSKRSWSIKTLTFWNCVAT
jgi:hypothetical protein